LENGDPGAIRTHDRRLRSSRELQALEDAPGDVRVFDGGDEAHRPAATGASKRVDLEDPL